MGVFSMAQVKRTGMWKRLEPELSGKDSLHLKPSGHGFREGFMYHPESSQVPFAKAWNQGDSSGRRINRL